MTRLLLLDDASAVNDLFARLVTAELGIEVVAMASVAAVESAVAEGEMFDVALIDLSFPEEQRTGFDACLAIHTARPQTILGIITQGDSFVAALLRDVWEVFPIATVISKAAPIPFQIQQIRQLIADGWAPIDPSVQPLLPAERRSSRDMASFERLLSHLGHAKLWEALLDSEPDVTYNDIVNATGLRLNTVRNYRAQMLPELANHGLIDPSLREMQAFAQRTRPVLLQVANDVRSRRRRSPDPTE